MRANFVKILVCLLTIFQLPPSHEGERHVPAIRNCTSSFQLPPSHEGEHSLYFRACGVLNFNSRPRMRANYRDGDPYQMNIISTPALA